MTKLSVDTHYEKGLNSQREIADLLAGRRRSGKRARTPGWLTDAFNLLMAASVGGACAWLSYNWLV